MKKKYEVSTSARQWAKHLRAFGKRLANKSTRKICKDRLRQNVLKHCAGWRATEQL